MKAIVAETGETQTLCAHSNSRQSVLWPPLITPFPSASLTSRDERPVAYSPVVTSPHCSTGMYSTIGENNTPTVSMQSSDSSRLSPAALAYTSDDLYSKFALAFSRRSDSLSSLSGPAPQAQLFPALPRRHDQNTLPMSPSLVHDLPSFATPSTKQKFYTIKLLSVGRHRLADACDSSPSPLTSVHRHFLTSADGVVACLVGI